MNKESTEADIERFNLLKNYRLIISLIFLLGVIIRLSVLAFFNPAMPYNAGGLFMEMAKQIHINSYQIPAKIPFYTIDGIPFAYPPLGFYFEAVLVYIMGIPKFLVANILPVIISIIALPSFYKLVKEYGLPQHMQVFSLLVFATIPAAFSQQTEAAGLAESIGTLALIWFAISLIKIYKNPTFGTSTFGGLMWAFCILSSPGSAYASIPTFIIFLIAFLFFQSEKLPNKKTWKTVLSLTITGVLFSSPYWVTVISNHGIGIFLNSFIQQHPNSGILIGGIKTLLPLARFNVVRSIAPFLWNFIIFSGAIWVFARRRKWEILAWLVILLIIPREAVWLVSVPASLMAAFGLEFWRKNLQRISNKLEKALIIIVIGVYLLSMGIAGNKVITEYPALSAGPSPKKAVEAMEWASSNLPKNGQIIALMGEKMDRELREWLPQIVRRSVINEGRGSEFTPKEGKQISELNENLSTCRTTNCISSNVLSRIQGVKITSLYLFINRDEFSKLKKDESFDKLWVNNEYLIGHWNNN